jgi:hypothetical protein
MAPKTCDSLYQYKLASFYTCIILWSMHTNICHNECNPKGSCRVKLFTLNKVYMEELCVGIESIYRSTYQRGRVKYLVSGDVVYTTWLDM